MFVVDAIVPGLKHPFRIRADVGSDIAAIKFAFFDKEFDFLFAGEPKFIIDAGANIGNASVFFANKFPNAKIVAIEPEESNFSILKKNCSPYPNIYAIQSALWNKEEYVRIKDPTTFKFSFEIERASQDDPNAFQAVTIQALLHQFGAEEIDILKIDIEGSEKELFSSNYEWLNKVHMLAVELHDYKKQRCLHNLTIALQQYPFMFKENRRSNLVLERTTSREESIRCISILREFITSKKYNKRYWTDRILDLNLRRVINFLTRFFK